MKKQLVTTLLGSALFVAAGSASAAYTALQYDFYGTVNSSGSVAGGIYAGEPLPIFDAGDALVFTESYDLAAITFGEANAAGSHIAWQTVWENVSAPGETYNFVEYLATSDLSALTASHWNGSQSEYFFGGPGGVLPDNQIMPITAGTWAVNTYIEGALQNTYGFQVNATVPEPAPLALMLSGLAAIGFASRKKAAKK